MMLKAVCTSPLPNAPYPERTTVHGWRFQIDHERLVASDTWALAAPDQRPWLLMLWATCWQQVPAGSFTDDDDVISARIGMDRRMFAAHRDVLLRGFRKHADGRLYHPVIVEQVQGVLKLRDDTKERVAKFREKKRLEKEKGVGVTRYQRVSNALVTAPEPEPEPDKKKKDPPYPPAGGNFQCPDGVDPQAWEDWDAWRRQGPKKRDWKGKALVMAANTLRPLTSEQQQATVARSIQAGWTGLFPRGDRDAAHQQTRETRSQRAERNGAELRERIARLTGADAP